MYYKIIISVVCLLLFSCENSNKTIDVYSHQVATEEERLEIMERYINAPTEFDLVAYHIWYQDNETGMIAGPSDYNIRLIVRVERDSIFKWIEGLTSTETAVSTQEWQALADSSDIALPSANYGYQSEAQTTRKVVFLEEELVLCYYSTSWGSFQYLEK